MHPFFIALVNYSGYMLFEHFPPLTDRTLHIYLVIARHRLFK